MEGGGLGEVGAGGGRGEHHKLAHGGRQPAGGDGSRGAPEHRAKEAMRARHPSEGPCGARAKILRRKESKHFLSWPH